MRAGDLATICSPAPGSTCGWGYNQREGLKQMPNGTPCLIINLSSEDSSPIVLAEGELFEISLVSLQQVCR